MRGLLDAGNEKGLLSMKARLFPRRLVGVITALFLLPINQVYADTYSDDSTYWRWWYVEQITDQMTDGNGVDTENIDDTYNGSTAGEYIYNSTGITADDVKEYVKTQYDNAVGYVDKTYDEYSNMIDDIWNSSVDVATNASYKAQKALRETVDTAGNTVVNVSSSSYWGNVYNDLYNNGSYKDVYVDVTDNSYTVGYNGQNVNFSFAGVGDYNYYMNSPTTKPAPANMFVSAPALFEQFVERTSSKNFAVGQMSVNGETYYFLIGSNNNYYYPYSDFNVYSEDETRVHVTVKYDNIFYKDATFIFNGPISGVGPGGTPVLQPKQVGFVMHNGIKYPVYTDPSLNPFKVNDSGNVTWDDGSGTEPIYVDPKELTDDGWLNILENVDNSDNTENPYNPFGRPWNTQDDGSALGGFFGNLIKDIGSVFKGLADTLSKLFSGLIDGILNALSSLFDINYNSITTVQLDVNFNIITTIWQKLLEILGVT